MSTLIISFIRRRPARNALKVFLHKRLYGKLEHITKFCFFRQCVLTASFGDTLQQLVNKEYPEIRDLAASSLADILPTLQKIDTDNNGMLLLHTVIMAAIGADGKRSPKESQLLHDLTGMNNEQIMQKL